MTVDLKKMTDADCAALYTAAHTAGMEAANACTPTPMIVQQHANPLDDSSPVVKTYPPVMGGVCGMAGISIKPGNSRFANWLKKKGYARKDSYLGGVYVNVSYFGQSYEKKTAYAGGFAGVLQDAGITRAWVDSRLD